MRKLHVLIQFDISDRHSSRLKQSGLFWTVRGANAIIALRCCNLNGRFEDYRESRPAA